MTAQDTRALVRSLIGDDVHAKRVASLGAAVNGVMSAASLSVCAIGRALAEEYELDAKHATKQVDRLLSNVKLDVDQLSIRYARSIVGLRKDIVVALDWTDFDKDDHTTLICGLVSSHGRALPLMWKTVLKSTLKDRRNQLETELIERMHTALDSDVTVTLLADRGFGAANRYAQLDLLGWHYVIRFKEGTLVTSADGETRKAKEWLKGRGRPVMLVGATVTKKAYDGGGVVVVHAAKMKDPWCLAFRVPAGTPASRIVELYGKRFKIEETFRDTKDSRFGMGWQRRERARLLAAID